MVATIAAIVLAGGPVQAKKWPEGPVKLEGFVTVEGRLAHVPLAKSKATVFVYVAPECPIANRYAPEIARIHAEYAAKGIGFFRVYALPLSQAAEVAQHTKDYSHKSVALLDPNLTVAKELGITVTPEVAVVTPDQKMVYRGRIDDQNIEHGKIRQGYRRDLRVALDEILAGKAVSVKESLAIGCFIPGM